STIEGITAFLSARLGCRASILSAALISSFVGCLPLPPSINLLSSMLSVSPLPAFEVILSALSLLLCAVLPLLLGTGPITFEITGGSPYGATTVTGGQGERMPSENELDAARFQGKHVATLTKKLAG
ncbi:hypothetical protein LCGC14_2771530, partial [marine sediment metagenome]